MTTTTLTFLVILLSITTLAFFILSFIVIKRNNFSYKTIKDLNNYIQGQLKEINNLTGESIRKDKLIDELDFKLKDELRFQEEQIQKHKELFVQENNEITAKFLKEKETLIKENGELLNIIENLEKVSNERLEEIKRLTNTKT